jgi:chromosome segregation ATPase
MTKSRRIPIWPVLLVVLVALSVGAIVATRYFRASSEQAAHLANLERENRELRAASEKFAQEAELLRRELAESEPGPVRAEAPHARSAPPIDAVEQAKLLFQFRDKLSSANSAIAGLQDRIHDLELTIQSSAEENKRLAASEADLKERIAASDRVLSAVKEELKGRDRRLEQLEASNKDLREQNRANTDKLAQISRLLRDLEEINRRRENYMASMVRRYKDVTEQYRALSARLDNPPDMSRIQDSIAMAEEDMRQLTSLNAQAARLQQRIGK